MYTCTDGNPAAEVPAASFEALPASPSSDQAPPRCYTVEDLMVILNVGRAAVYALLRRGEFRSFRIGGQYRISRKSFDAWLDDQL